MAGVALWPRVRAVAYAFKDFTESPPNTNRGQVVDRFVTWGGLDPKGAYPWCACYVGYVGYWALYDHVSQKSVWPLPRTAGCAVLGEFATTKQVLFEAPTAGDVFLVWHAALKRFAHTGYVVTVNADGSCKTIEGNTSGAGSREGWGVFERTRHFTAKDRFIRWNDLL